jgi:hypothetical protein
MNKIVIPISDEPNYGFKRTATMAGLSINVLPFLGENLVLIVQIDYYDKTDKSIDLIPSKIVNLQASGESFFKYLEMINEPVIIKDEVIKKIQESDLEKLFD